MRNLLTMGLTSDILRMKGAERMIYNVTVYSVTPELKENGVATLKMKDHYEVTRLLTFNQIPTSEEMENRAMGIVEILRKYPDADQVLIGGSVISGPSSAPFFTSTLERVLRESGYTPVYAFQRFNTQRSACRDGSVVEFFSFRHEGFVSPVSPLNKH